MQQSFFTLDKYKLVQQKELALRMCGVACLLTSFGFSVGLV